jgi:hypothetical protein
VLRLGLGSTESWTEGERLAFRRWAPILVQLDGIERWSRTERRAALDVVRSKGGRSESDFVLRFDAHAKLRESLLRLMRGKR